MEAAAVHESGATPALEKSPGLLRRRMLSKAGYGPS